MGVYLIRLGPGDEVVGIYGALFYAYGGGWGYCGVAFGAIYEAGEWEE